MSVAGHRALHASCLRLTLAIAAWLSACASPTERPSNLTTASVCRPGKPQIRTLIAFVRVKPDKPLEAINTGLSQLEALQRAFTHEGYAVRTLRITTQDFPQYIKLSSAPDKLAATVVPDDDLNMRLMERLNGFATARDLMLSIGSLSPVDVPNQDTFSTYAGFQRRVLGRFPKLYTSLSLTDRTSTPVEFAIEQAANTILALAQTTPPGLSLGEANFQFAATAMMEPSVTTLRNRSRAGVGDVSALHGPPYPYFASSLHTIPEGEHPGFAIGVETVPIVRAFFECEGRSADADDSVTRLRNQLRAAMAPIDTIAKRFVGGISGIRYFGIDATPPPIGTDSIHDALTAGSDLRFGQIGERVRILSRAVKRTGTFWSEDGDGSESSSSGGDGGAGIRLTGFLGVFVPVMEDKGLSTWYGNPKTEAPLKTLLAHSTVCGAGLDTIPLGWEGTTNNIEELLRIVARQAIRYRKPLTARLLMRPGVGPGDELNFGGDNPFLFATKTRNLAVELGYLRGQAGP